MTHIKLTGADAEAFKATVAVMAAGAKRENEGKKARDKSKETLTKELQRLRKIDLATLPDKELVVVQCDGVDVLKVERKSRQQLDQAKLAAAHPELVTEFTGPNVASYFDSLLPTA